MNNKLASTLGLAYISNSLHVGQDNINRLNYNKLKIVIFDKTISKKYIEFLKKINSERDIIFYEVDENFISSSIGIKNAKLCAITKKSFTKKVIEIIGE